MAPRNSSGQKRLSLSHPDKVLYPAAKFTKRQVADYYAKAAPFLLPHFRNHPVTLKRYPDGVEGEVFYEKDAPSFTPSWVKRFPVPRREGDDDICYILINDRATLTWAADISAIELHPFLHHVPHLDRPAHVVFDLDPGEGSDLLDCAEVAFLLREVLQKLRLKSWPKVSGSKGIQVYVPLNGTCTYAQTQPFAHAIAKLLEQNEPDRIVAEMPKNLRVGKVFIDWSQNADFKTTVGVYSLRAKRHRPYVSMPVRWEELKKALKKGETQSLYFPPAEALQRLRRVGDLFAPLLKVKQSLPKEFATIAPERRPEAPNSLESYARNRNFDRSVEPPPKIPRRSAQGSRRRFVIQKHAASHLHYDFRLEMHDVLKSWAVPKGLPLQKDESHSGFETEDHPIEYLEFEGIIPQGEYGGGSVMVWDIGTYEVVEGNYWKGFLRVALAGKKLRGEWTLERVAEEKEKRRWLIRRIAERRRSGGEEEDVSALSGRDMEEIAGDNSAVWRSSRAQSTAGGNRVAEVEPKTKAPQFVKPMKATAVTELPEGEEWIYEVKWDGYRALALKNGNTVRLLSLKEKDLTIDFPVVASAVKEITASRAVIDGEIVAINTEGCPSFQALQNRALSGKGWRIVYYAFDLLELDGRDLKQEPLHSRKEILRQVLADSPVRFNAALSGRADVVVASVKAAGLEGIIAKKRDSVYRAGTRMTAWLKFKLNKGQEFVIGGYKPEGGSVQSILVGYYKKADLIFAGKLRQGFNPGIRTKLLKSMRPFLTDSCPFANLPSSRKSHFGAGITSEEMSALCWLKPKLVAQVSFTEWTNYGLLRHATFEGLRDDKSPTSIVREPG